MRHERRHMDFLIDHSTQDLSLDSSLEDVGACAKLLGDLALFSGSEFLLCQKVCKPLDELGWCSLAVCTPNYGRATQKRCGFLELSADGFAPAIFCVRSPEGIALALESTKASAQDLIHENHVFERAEFWPKVHTVALQN